MKYVNQIIERLENPKHQHDVREYITIRQEVDKVTLNTLKADVQAISHLSKYLKSKTFQTATRDDIRKFSLWLLKQEVGDGRTMKETTRDLHLMKIKRFYKYIADPDKYQNGRADQRDIKYPDSVRWITYKPHDDDELPLDYLLSDKDVKKLLDSCENTREQAVIVSLLDGGLRKSELIVLKYKNVGFDRKLGAYFILPKNARNLKTGMRKIQLFLIPSSTTYIREYMNHHLHKSNPEAPFIYSYDRMRKKDGIPLSDKGIDEILHRVQKHSGLKINLHAHVLRHNSATRCAAKGFNESMMRERYGWKKNSAMPSRYIHLTQVDSDNKIRQILGITEEKTEELSVLQPKICPNCDYENVPTNIVCGRCGMKLNITKEDIGMTASNLGVILQKAQKDSPEAQQIIEDVLGDYLEKLIIKKMGKINKEK